ncbi:MAG TPA: oligoribonuclease [Egibacteraceae bacterium]|nr:oligoribonuclease [Egibacteraceae bacterium]
MSAGFGEGEQGNGQRQPLTQPLVWVDLEMTGLDPSSDVIVEIATIVTDGALERIEEGPDLVIHQPPEALQRMIPVVAEMHATSGLTEEIARSTMTCAEAERLTLEFVRRHVPTPGAAPLAGNSVHADRAFLQRYMPSLSAHLHYRNVDVSTIKELAKRWYPDAVEGSPEKGGGHRALADIRESIEELRYYRGAVFR